MGLIANTLFQEVGNQSRLHRGQDRDGKTWFGVNLIPDTPLHGAVIQRGDPVEIVQQAGPDGPLR